MERFEKSRKGGPLTRPVLDDQEMEGFTQTIAASKHNGTEIVIRLWGQDDPITGVVLRIDAILRRIVLAHSSGKTEIRIDDIIGVKC